AGQHPMIPVRLNLHNFLPYRDPNPIMFEGVHLACLTGENGAGKSSLLDAMTWAIWGKARARDNDLIHMDATQMYIELDFVHEGQKYRIIRSRKREGLRGTGRLQLFIYDEDSQLTDISETSMRETQRRINNLLSLEHETFVNSAFLQQGQADAFTVKRPAERKQILSDILGLDVWNDYEDLAKEKLKQIEEQLGKAQWRIDQINTELAKETVYKQELADKEKVRDEIAAQLDAAEALLEEVQAAPVELRSQQDRLNAETQRRAYLQQQLERAEREVRAREREMEEHRAVLADREEIEAGYAALQEARDANEELNLKYRELTDIDAQIRDLTGSLNEERTRIEGERTAQQERITALDEQIAAVNPDELPKIQAEIDSLNERAAEREALQVTFAALETEGAERKATNAALYETMNDLKERIDSLSEVEGAACPLCGQPLTDDHRETILAELQEEGTGYGDTYRANNERLNEITAERKTHKATIEAIAVEIQRLPALQSKAGQLGQQVETANAAQAERAERQGRLDALNETLEKEDFGTDIRTAIAELEAQRDALGYDQQTHDGHTATLKTYQNYGERYTRLEISEKALPKLEQAQAEQREHLEGLENDITAVDKHLIEMTAEVGRLKTLVETHNLRTLEAMRLRTQAAGANEQVGAARQHLTALEKQRKERALVIAERDAAAEEQSIYDELRRAFGKQGVPAMIIETAIPELEATTNDLLGRITDGRMAVKFSMQREKITGGTSETLDIEIADELGTRSYDLYSGGEAFRINFAVRVALSKMLARRAGAHLETLFIDEGFGTQDADGRTKLIEAINAIRDDFALILVITHIDELKDAFPVHVNVEKTPNGSQVVVR
ncbi:MAG: SMC family ATPase, partial [Chloroflexota bacterium]